MRVTVRLFARLREIAGAADLTRDVPAPATAATVWASLVAEFPALAPYAPTISCAVNEEYAKLSTPVREGDEVAFLPPVSGGEAAEAGEHAESGFLHHRGNGGAPHRRDSGDSRADDSMPSACSAISAVRYEASGVFSPPQRQRR
jgi:molybdopterin converting factor subunit 1